MKKLGLYVHVPFCVKKCKYCGFLSFEGCGDDEMGRYMSALFSEARFWGERSRALGYTVDTVFIGGGTPSILPAAYTAKLMDTLRESFAVEPGAEITSEANPGTLDAEKLKLYREAGINRLSIGVQSMSDEALRLLGRIHSAEEAVKGVEAARAAGFENINLDLMFAIPRHSMSVWENTLRKAIALRPAHISFYSLQLEEETEFFRQFERGELSQVSDELDRQMYHAAVRIMQEAGYEHYEISNAALRGFECRHNLKYWSFDEYLGLGLGASSFVKGGLLGREGRERGANFRLTNTAEPEQYCDTQEREVSMGIIQNSLRDDAFEYVFTALRKKDGVDFDDFERKTGAAFKEYYKKKMPLISQWHEQGLAVLDGAGFRLTLRGIDISNSIMAEFSEG